MGGPGLVETDVRHFQGLACDGDLSHFANANRKPAKRTVQSVPVGLGVLEGTTGAGDQMQAVLAL